MIIIIVKVKKQDLDNFAFKYFVNFETFYIIIS